MLRALLVACLLFMVPLNVKAETKMLTIAIGSIPGGGPDANARLLAKHLPKYLPNTSVVVQNMPGAGGLIVANWLYNKADPENTIGSFTVLNNTLLNAIVGNDKVQFDPLKFKWLFSTADGADDAIVLWANKWRGLERLEQMMRPNEFVIGSQAAGEVSMQGVLLKDVLKTQSKFVTGYKDILMAIENGEIDAYVGRLQSALATRPHWVKKGYKIQPILQFGRVGRHEDLPDVPNMEEYINDDQGRALLSFFNKQNRMARVFVAPPGVSDATLNSYIRAGELIAHDPEYLADMEKLNLESKFIQSKELTALVGELVSTPESVITEIKRLSAAH